VQVEPAADAAAAGGAAVGGGVEMRHLPSGMIGFWE
jgi:hypothetical protein